MRWRQLYYIVGEFDRISGTQQEALRRVEVAVEQESRKIEIAASQVIPEFRRIADAIELFVAA
jgi:hypothetical protein